MDVFTESGERSSLALEARRVLNGNYEIGRVLGKGGFGITYAALDRSLKMPVAIKEYLPTSVAGRGTDRATVEPHGGKDADVFENGLSAFLKEGQTLAKFNHPNIVRVLAFFRDNGTGYLVMPFLEGRTLAQHVRDLGGRISSEEAARIILPVLDGLRSVHGAGFLHRDIKPQNIYLTDNGGVILIDFGAARITFGQESQSLSAVLTPGYAPFEQYYRKGNQGAWTDVYAAAATFYRAITGIRPPESPERNEVDHLVPANQVEPSIQQAVSDALDRALMPRPEDRTQTVDAFYSELQRALGDEAVPETQIIHTTPFPPPPAADMPPSSGAPFPLPGSPKAMPPEEEEMMAPETVLDAGPPSLAAKEPMVPETVLDAAPPPVRPFASPPPVAPPVSTPDSDSGGSSTTPTARLTLSAKKACIIHIDGEEVARLAKGETRTFMLPPGSHQISARGSGGVTRESSVDLVGGEERRVEIRLDRGGTRGTASAGAGASGSGDSKKGLWIGGGVVLLLIIAVAALWPRNDANIQTSQTNIPNPPVNNGVIAENQTQNNVPLPPPTTLEIAAPYLGTGILGPGDNTLQSGEYVDGYRFYGYAGDYVAATLTSTDFDTFLIILDPAGTRYDHDDDEGDTTTTFVEDILVLEGWYEIMVTSYSPGETGSYSLELSN